MRGLPRLDGRLKRRGRATEQRCYVGIQDGGPLPATFVAIVMVAMILLQLELD